MTHQDTGRIGLNLLVSFILSSVAACSPATPEPLLSTQQIATSLPALETPLAASPLPATPTMACTSGLDFLQDLTIPDDTVVAPGTPIDKQWLVANTGTCNWSANYRLRFIDGELMGAQPEYALYPARAGSQATISILFTAPSQSGVYISEWQAFDPDGLAFGDSFFVKVLVNP